MLIPCPFLKKGPIIRHIKAMGSLKGVSVAVTSGRLFRILDAVGSNLDGFLRTKGRNGGIYQRYPSKEEFLKSMHYS